MISIADTGADAPLGAWMIVFAIIAVIALMVMLPVWIGSQVHRAVANVAAAVR